MCVLGVVKLSALDDDGMLRRKPAAEVPTRRGSMTSLMNSCFLAVRSSLPVLMAFLWLGCSVYDPGLLQGGTGGTSGTGGSGGTSGTGGNCVPSNNGVETCDNQDNDCNGVTDDGAAADSCRTEYGRIHATSICNQGACLVQSCDLGFYDCNGDYGNGCETPQSEVNCERCRPECPTDTDGGDDDGGLEDSGMSTPDGSVDASTDAGTDANVVCVPSGAETCDGVDNDCNGMTDDASACPAGCTGHTLTTGVYALCSMPVTWVGARSGCRHASLAMEMIRIDDAAENAAVHAMAGNIAFWIGATDSDGVSVEGGWEWLDGTQFWMGGTPALGGVPVGGLYTNWATDSAGQPDNAGSIGEDCAEMTAGGVWNDIVCTSTRQYVCEL